KNRNESTHYLFAIPRLLVLKTEDLLPHDETGKHSHERAGGQLRIDLAKGSISDPPLNVIGDWMPLSHARDEHVGKLMPFQRTEEKKTHERRVGFMLFQKSPTDRLEKLLVVTPPRQPLQVFMIRIALAGLLFDNGAIQFFLRLEVAENDRFIHLS